MSYYRSLPTDVKVALWVDEHPKFMKAFGLAASATSVAGVVAFFIWLVR